MQRQKAIAAIIAIITGLFLLAMVLFVIGLVIGYTDGLVSVIVLSLVVGSIVLAPAIVFNYAVRAAERDDVERGL